MEEEKPIIIMNEERLVLFILKAKTDQGRMFHGVCKNSLFLLMRAFEIKEPD